MPATDVDIAAITLDLDDTLWPIAPVIARAEERLDAWLKMQCPRAAAAYPVAAMRELRERVAADNPHLAHDFSAQRQLSLRHVLIPHGYGETHVEAAYAEYFAARKANLPQPLFLSKIPLRLRVTDASQRIHLPVTFGPWSYNYYRGS